MPRLSKNNIAAILFLPLILILLISLFFNQEKTKELYIYNWADYLDPEVVSDFEKKYNIKVNLSFYDDEYTMLKKLQNNSGDETYDLTVASDAILEKMIRNNLISPINKNNIPNLKNIGQEFIDNKFNIKELYAIPYVWGTTGLVINTKYIPSNTDSWGVLWDKKYQGHICALNNPDETIGMAAKYLGFSLVPQSMKEMDKVKEVLFSQKKIIGNYCDPDSIKDDLVSEKLQLLIQLQRPSQLPSLNHLQQLNHQLNQQKLRLSLMPQKHNLDTRLKKIFNCCEQIITA